MTALEKIKEMKDQVENWRQAGLACMIGAAVFAPVAIVFGGGLLMANPSALISIGLSLLSLASFSVSRIKSIGVEKMEKKEVLEDQVPMPEKRGANKPSLLMKFETNAAPAVKKDPAPYSKKPSVARKHD